MPQLSLTPSAKTLPPADRAGILTDLNALTRAGLIDAAEVVKFLAAFAKEDNPNVWTAISQVILAFDRVLSGSAIYASFRTFVEQLIAPAMDAVGWDGRPDDHHLSRIMRSTLVALVGRFSTRQSDMDAARARFDAVLAAPSDPKACSSEQRTTVFQMVLQRGGAAEFDRLWAHYSRLSSDVERKQVMFSIGHTPISALRERAMDWAVSGAVKLQDFFYTFTSVAASADGIVQAWTYFQKHFAHVTAMTASTPNLLDGLIAACCSSFSSMDRAQEIESFFAEHPLPSSTRKLTQLVEGIRVAAAHRTRLESSGLAAAGFWDHLLCA